MKFTRMDGMVSIKHVATYFFFSFFLFISQVKLSRLSQTYREKKYIDNKLSFPPIAAVNYKRKLKIKIFDGLQHSCGTVDCPL